MRRRSGSGFRPENELKSLYDRAFDLAGRGKAALKEGDAEAAKFLSVEAAECFMLCYQKERDTKKRNVLEEQLTWYFNHIKQLNTRLSEESKQHVPQSQASNNQESWETQHAQLEAEAEFLEKRARELDETSCAGDAVAQYRKAAKVWLDLLEELKKRGASEKERAPISTRVSGLLSRISTIQKKTAGRAPQKAASRGTKLSKGEIAVLRRTSIINGHTYLPFDAGQDTSAMLWSERSFRDPDGLVALSPKQREAFGGWRRPSSIWPKKKLAMIKLVTASSIKQTLITDCSFISAISVAAHYELRWKKQLITKIIYPQDSGGKPVYNPYGHYMIKLVLNGVPRKVEIDDTLPVDRGGQLLCSYSMSGELWVSLIEKAFLKVMGGYDFPGSNGGVDLHVLTGWIPERISLQSDLPPAEKLRIWERMKGGVRFGDALVTASTGPISEELADSLGLVPTHAYAVLRVEEACGKRLLLLKNPWSRKRWRGAFSPQDAANWTPALRRALQYDRAKEAMNDNGMFWMDFDTLCDFYGALYLNWNPDLFAHKTTFHGAYPRLKGVPKVDTLNREFCPQFQLGVTVPRPLRGASARDASIPLWILLSKHVTEKKEQEDEFITLHVYGMEKAGLVEVAPSPGKTRVPSLVYYPDSPAVRGTYINIPHYLARMDLLPGENIFKIVISQYEKVYDLSYSLHAFCAVPIRMGAIPARSFPHVVERAGAWDARTAGGSSNQYSSFFTNPQFRLSVSEATNLNIKLFGPREFALNLMVFQGTSGRRMQKFQDGHRVADSGNYRPGFCMLQLPLGPQSSTLEAYLQGAPPEAVLKSQKVDCEATSRLGAGTALTLVVSAFQPGKQGPFRLVVASSACAVTVQPL